MPRTSPERKTSASDFSTLIHPHSSEAERNVLGAILLDNDLLDDVADDVRSEDFFENAHQCIFDEMVRLHHEHQPIELTILADRLRRAGKLDEAGGVVYLAQLEHSVLTIGAAAEHAKIVAEKATLRRLMGAAQAILRDASEERRPVAETLDVAEKLIFEISHQTGNVTFRPLKDLMEHALAEIAERMQHRGETSGIATHYPNLDRILNGLQPSNLLILAARPSIGKTAFAVNIATNIAIQGGRPVAIFSLEMAAEELNLRMLCTEARIPSNQIKRGYLTHMQEESLRRAEEKLAAAPIYIDDSPVLSLMQIRSRARRLKARYANLGLIIVDYLQLVTVPELRKRDSNRQVEVSEISRGLKALARELRVPVMALSQLSRGIESRGSKKEPARPQLSDLRESGAIEQDADVVMFVHRERLEIMKEKDGERRPPNITIPAEIIVAKHRNGATGRADMIFFPHFTHFAAESKTGHAPPPEDVEE